MRGQYISEELQATILTARWFSRTDSLVRKSIPHTCKIGKLLFGPHNHIQSGARSRSYIDGFLMWNTSWKIGENSEFVVVHISQWISEFQNVSKPPKTSSNLPWKSQSFKKIFLKWKSFLSFFWRLWWSDRKLIEFFAVKTGTFQVSVVHT